MPLSDRTSLAQWRRKVGECEESGIYFFNELAVRFGFVADALPLRVILEGLPVRSRGFAAGMTKNIDQGVAFFGFVHGGPVGDALHSVAVKYFHSVIAEAGVEIAQLSRRGVIDAEFIDRCRALRKIGVVLLSSGQKRGRKKCDGWKSLQQGSSFHGRNSSRGCTV